MKGFPFTAKKVKEGKLEEKVKIVLEPTEEVIEPTFKVGDIINHATLGDGLIDRRLPDGRYSIIFGKSRRDVNEADITLTDV